MTTVLHDTFIQEADYGHSGFLAQRIVKSLGIIATEGKNNNNNNNNKIVFQSKTGHHRTRYTDTFCRYTVCLRICGPENVKSAHPAGRLRKSNMKCLHAAALMTKMDLSSLRLQSCSHLSLEWRDYLS